MCFGNAMCFMFHVFMVVYVKSLCVSPMLSVCPKQISLVRETIKYLLIYLYIENHWLRCLETDLRKREVRVSRLI